MRTVIVKQRKTITTDDIGKEGIVFEKVRKHPIVSPLKILVALCTHFNKEGVHQFSAYQNQVFCYLLRYYSVLNDGDILEAYYPLKYRTKSSIVYNVKQIRHQLEVNVGWIKDDVRNLIKDIYPHEHTLPFRG